MRIVRLLSFESKFQQIARIQEIAIIMIGLRYELSLDSEWKNHA